MTCRNVSTIVITGHGCRVIQSIYVTSSVLDACVDTYTKNAFVYTHICTHTHTLHIYIYMNIFTCRRHACFCSVALARVSELLVF